MPSGRFLNLRAKPFNDADLLLDVLSKEGERRVLTAKNALRSKRRFGGGVLEPLNFVEIYFTQAKSGFLYVQEARVLHGFQDLRKDYKKLERAFYFVQMVSQGTHEGLTDNTRLFDLLGNSLRTLEKTERLDLLQLHFEMKYLFYMGFLALNEETSEFVAHPVQDHHKIHLTSDEYFDLKQRVKSTMKQFELSLKQDLHSHL
jgi:DNA repair protein RecO (recombination protein O)